MDFNVDTNSQLVYTVTANGWRNGYGAEIYLLGVFDNLSDAEFCAKCVIEAKITAVGINKMFPLIKDEWGDLANENYLGGYCE